MKKVVQISLSILACVLIMTSLQAQQKKHKQCDSKKEAQTEVKVFILNSDDLPSKEIKVMAFPGGEAHGQKNVMFFKSREGDSVKYDITINMDSMNADDFKWAQKVSPETRERVVMQRVEGVPLDFAMGRFPRNPSNEMVTEKIIDTIIDGKPAKMVIVEKISSKDMFFDKKVEMPAPGKTGYHQILMKMLPLFMENVDSFNIEYKKKNCGDEIEIEIKLKPSSQKSCSPKKSCCK